MLHALVLLVVQPEANHRPGGFVFTVPVTGQSRAEGEKDAGTFCL
jgi:hypothetical protein